MPEHMWECQDGKEEEIGGEEEIYVLLWEQLTMQIGLSRPNIRSSNRKGANLNENCI